MKTKPFVLLLGWALAAAAGAQEAHRHGDGSAPPDAPLRSETGARPSAPPAWTDQPLLLPATRGRERAGLRPVGIAAARVTVFAPGDGAEDARADVAVEHGAAQVRPSAPDRGNYHWVQAREETREAVRVASTVRYFSAPGPAPTAMLARSRSELEIVPMPLPREHAQYREGEQWRFLVRWQGQPLAGQALSMETGNGTRTRAVTDDAGVATLVFPRDFEPSGTDAPDGGERRRRAPFVLSTTHTEFGRRYVTAFNHVYAPDPLRSRSLAWGAAFGVLGMVLAAPLLRRKEPTDA